MSETNEKILEGEVRSIVFSNESGSFTVARLLDAKGQQTTIVGSLGGVEPGEFLRMQGEWVENEKFGKQFKVQNFLVQSPKTLIGMERYLASGSFPGIGPKTAKKIVEHFGDATLEVINSTPEKLAEVAGIKKNRLDKLIDSWGDRRQFGEVMVFLQSHGVSPAFADRICKRYKEQSVQILKSNPYRLAWEIHGIGFKKADQIALEVGVEKNSATRCAAAVIYLLTNASKKGHVFFPLDRVIAETMELIDVQEEHIGSGVKLAMEDELIALEDLEWHDEATDQYWRGQVLYLKRMLEAELGAADELARLLKQPPLMVPNKDEVTQHLEAMRQSQGIELGTEQVEALRATLFSRVSIITGGPGTGKTTMIRALVRLLEKKQQKISLAAPTGRAAKRLAEATELEAKTIHRLLEYQPRRGFTRNHENHLDCDWVIIDETSMVDVFLIHALLQAIPDHACVLLVGDIDQLPSVGSGNVLHDIIGSGKVEVSRLTQIYRQAKGSLITLNAHAINRGVFPKLIAFDKIDAAKAEDEELELDCLFVREDDPEKMVPIIQHLAKEAIPKRYNVDCFESIQVITPMHRGPVGSQNLNRVLQEALNPTAAELVRGNRTLKIGDRVMQIRNNYDKDVYNGDIGQILSIDSEASEVLVRFDYVEASYTMAELDELELAYAITVHKSQGSEYPVVILPVTTQHFIMLQKNLLYTALTRGKMLVVLVGSTKAIGLALSNDSLAKRYSNLATRIRQSIEAASA